MALIDPKAVRKIVPPHEPESWFEVRPIRAGDFENLRTDGHQITLNIDLLASLISAWSYSVPVDRANVANLDLDTFGWLSAELMKLSGIRADEEKKDSNGSSPPVTLLQRTAINEYPTN